MGDSVPELFTFWTGENDMPEIRRKSLESMRNSNCNVVLIDSVNIFSYIKKNEIHPAYWNLNLAHRADYLRCYFMRHFGGGYCDIKAINHSWLPHFEELGRQDDLWAIGYQEIGRHGVANLYDSACLLQRGGFQRARAWLEWRWMQLHYKEMIGLGAFIFKPKNPLVDEWWEELNVRLDWLLPELRLHPAKYPKERLGHVYGGNVSTYPVPWSFILGDILHPLILKYKKRISTMLPPPDFSNYQ
jgi:hypothetical protein